MSQKCHNQTSDSGYRSLPWAVQLSRIPGLAVPKFRQVMGHAHHDKAAVFFTKLVRPRLQTRLDMPQLRKTVMNKGFVLQLVSAALLVATPASAMAQDN